MLSLVMFGTLTMNFKCDTQELMVPVTCAGCAKFSVGLQNLILLKFYPNYLGTTRCL